MYVVFMTTTKNCECDDCGKAISAKEHKARIGVCGSCDLSVREGNTNAGKWGAKMSPRKRARLAARRTAK